MTCKLTKVSDILGCMYLHAIRPVTGLRDKCETHHNRIPLSYEDLDGVDNKRLHGGALDLDDRHIMPVDGEDVVRVAGDINDAEAVPLALLH